MAGRDAVAEKQRAARRLLLLGFGAEEADRRRETGEAVLRGRGAVKMRRAEGVASLRRRAVLTIVDVVGFAARRIG